MKKILFVLPYYKIGGTLTSFINLIPLIDKNKYEISAFALTSDVEASNILPSGVNYIGQKKDSTKERSTNIVCKKRIINFLKSCKRALTAIGYDPSDIIFKIMAKPLSKKYDIVIAYQEGAATRMARYITTSQRIAWIHCVYSRFKKVSKASTVGIYDDYDKIVCVSHTAAKDMADCEPQWSKKINIVYNAINSRILTEKACNCIAFEKKINIVTIGRIDPVKRVSYIPQIAYKLRQTGIDFNWWIIGGIAVQKEFDKLMANIKHYEVEDCVHSIGTKPNPYPYIKSSNLLVCLSSSETFNYTIAEAKALCTPIVTTDFPCAFEFIVHEKTGLILPLEHIADGIIRLLSNTGLYEEIKQNLLLNSNSTPLTKEQIESLLSNE